MNIRVRKPMYVDMDVSVSDTVCQSIAISRLATLGKGVSWSISVCQSATLVQLDRVKCGVSVRHTRYRGK